MKLYVLRNKEGKFFRSKGYGGYGPSWRNTLEEAKFYAKIGPAKAQVTYWFKNHPKFGCPELLVFELDPANATVLNMEGQTTARAKVAKIQEARSVVRNLENDIQYKTERLQKNVFGPFDRRRLQIDLEEARAELVRADAVVNALLSAL